MSPYHTLTQHPDPTLASLAIAVIQGDDVAHLAVQDFIEEEGITVYREDFVEVAEVGDNVVLMTDTFYWIGKIAKIGNSAVILDEAAWIADMGRFANALSSGPRGISEAEPVPGSGRMGVPLAHIRTYIPWPHPTIRQVQGG